MLLGASHLSCSHRAVDARLAHPARPHRLYKDDDVVASGGLTVYCMAPGAGARYNGLILNNDLFHLSRGDVVTRNVLNIGLVPLKLTRAYGSPKRNSLYHKASR